MGGPRGKPDPRGPIGIAMGAMLRDLGPPANIGGIPLERDAPPDLSGGGGGNGSLCR